MRLSSPQQRGERTADLVIHIDLAVKQGCGGL
jgi:hypothetical protein